MSKRNRDKTEEEENIDPLIEYFYIIGPNPEIIKNEDFFNNFQSSFINAKILSKFPPVEKHFCSIKDEIVISHCFPNGYCIEESNPGKKIFHFSIENIFPHPHEKSRIYYTCLLFYESLSRYFEVKHKKNYNLFSDRNLEEISNNFQKTKRMSVTIRDNPFAMIEKKNVLEKYYVPKIICFCSSVPFPYEFGYLLNKLINYALNNANNEKNIDDNKKEDKNNSENENTKENDNTNKIEIPIEKIIEKLVVEVPMPMRGIFFLNFKNNNAFFKKDEKELIIKQKIINDYYCPSYPLQSIFSFNINDILEIYKSLLLEIPILFFSSNIEKLTNIYESFLCLLYPFNCQCPHVSILPDINSAIIQNFETFVFGINQEWITEKIIDNKKEEKDYFERNNITIINKAILICDIDNSRLDIYFKKIENEHIVNFKDLGKNENNTNNNINIPSSRNINSENKYENTKYILPTHYTEKLRKKLENFLNLNKNLNLYEYNEEYNKQIGEGAFFYFLVCIFGKYNNYLYNTQSEIKKICKDIFCKDKKGKDINTIFNLSKFLSECKSSDCNFYNAFMQTEMFWDFIKRKYNNKKVDRALFLYFDEKIIIKRNKSFLSKRYETPFINLQIFNNPNNIDIDNYKNFNEDELKYISENKKELLDYYQTYNGKEFKYSIFPRLLYDNKFFLNKNNLNGKNSSSTDLKINSEYKLNYHFNYSAIDFTMIYRNLLIEIYKDKQYFKIYKGDLIVQDKFDPNKTLYDEEIQNSLYLLWLRLFCLTFYYCSKEEKNLRFYEMINMVKKLKYVKDDIFSLILYTLDRYGNEIMMIQFFSVLTNYNYIQYSYLSHKLIKEKPIKSLLKKMSVSNTSLTIDYYTENQEEYIIPHINQNDMENIKQRTFGINNKNDNGTEEENIYFSHNIKCNNCGESLEISGLTLNYKGMKKTYNLVCRCKKELTNKITIKVNGKYYKISLYEPYYLYKIVSTELLQKYGNKLSLDKLRIKYKDFYWNCIWYFGSQGLSYDMLLKYKDDSIVTYEEIKPIKKETPKKKIVKRKKKFDFLKISSLGNNDVITNKK